MPLIQLVYYSRNRAAGQDRPQLDVLRAILAESCERNARDEITGFLLVDRCWFLQVLEGERARVIATYERIQRDTRHADVTLLAMKDVAERRFPASPMGGSVRTPDQAEIYLRHGIGERLDPTRLTAATILALSTDLEPWAVSVAETLRAAG